MPLYEYRCQHCRRVFEVLQRMGQSGSGLSCPACGSPAIERALSTFACSTTGGAEASAPAGGCGQRGGFS